MELLKTFSTALSPLGIGPSAVQDTLRWAVIGGTVETARRMSKSAWNGFVDSFFLTAHFSQEDYPYDWLLHWLSKQPAWGQSREFEITTRSVGRSQITQTTTGDVDDEEEDDDDELIHGRRKRKVSFMPSLGTTHTIYYRGHWLRITRTKRTTAWGNCAELSVSVIARNNSILKKLVLEAKRDYEKDAEHRVHIFMADSYGSWRWNGARQKRPMSSIVLEPGVKDMLLADCRDFLTSEDWYAERGIPFRRGYLLHGVPGSGKTSLIHSLAGELGLDIYVVSLSSKGMSDNTLATLMGQVPSRCILLLEDLDAAFTRGVSRDANSTGSPTSTTTTSTTTTPKPTTAVESDGSTLSLSGLLNSLDGVAAAEGRLLFATTNHIERLDPALSRPGRMDVWVNFTNASKWQAEGIFKCFFPSKASKEREAAAKAKADAEARGTSEVGAKNLPGSKRKASAHAAPVLDEEELNALAKRFSEQIPDDEMSVASLQGYLLKNKTRPRECVDEVAEWIIKERELKAKLKKEKEEKEKKEKEEAEKKEKEEKEEKEKKEKEEKEAKEKEEKEAKEKEEKEKAEKKDAETPKALPSPPETPGTEKTEPVAESSSTPEPTPASPAATDSSSESASESDGNGADADTESVTSDEDIDKLVDAATTTEAVPKGSEKWVNVKSTQTTPPSETAQDA
ncbi:P-loop containing nucleoside triphosphate hydrolase protein [Schizopora paradoxa]|uniref:p-loop containing nucleoside triphosphate hydrolase protein n=1 Tax=Schizopora paradoxa TaxID=27342 RepID=A0A0H2RGK1_9AGAM|nr:P-loop containing nucleoside triphosphate hydrolase protein [Schizopora paradoxa]